jgi:hypothetical protein
MPWREDDKRGEDVKDADDDARMRPGIEEDCQRIRRLLIVYRGFIPTTRMGGNWRTWWLWRRNRLERAALP